MFLSILQPCLSVILLIPCREYVPRDVENGLNFPQPEVDCSHSGPLFSPSQSITIKETTSNLRISTSILCVMKFPRWAWPILCTPEPPKTPCPSPWWVILCLHQLTSNAFDSTWIFHPSPKRVRPSGLPWTLILRSSQLGTELPDPFLPRLQQSPCSFGDSGVYEFTTQSLLSSVYPVPLFWYLTVIFTVPTALHFYFVIWPSLCNILYQWIAGALNLNFKVYKNFRWIVILIHNCSSPYYSNFPVGLRVAKDPTVQPLRVLMGKLSFQQTPWGFRTLRVLPVCFHTVNSLQRKKDSRGQFYLAKIASSISARNARGIVPPCTNKRGRPGYGWSSGLTVKQLSRTI